MPDLAPENVKALLAASGVSPQDEEELQEVTHRINAIIEAVSALDDALIEGAQEGVSQ